MRDRISGPCQDCKSRYLGCHDECASYKEFRNKKDEINSALREGKSEVINEYKMMRTAKVKKSKGEKSW